MFCGASWEPRGKGEPACFGTSILFIFFFLPHGMWDLSSPTRDWTCVPALEAQSLKHWTNRGVQCRLFGTDAAGSSSSGNTGTSRGRHVPPGRSLPRLGLLAHRPTELHRPWRLESLTPLWHRRENWGQSTLRGSQTQRRQQSLVTSRPWTVTATSPGLD